LYRTPALTSSYLPRLASSPFSTSSIVRAAQATSGEADAELSAKLQSELSFEDEMAEQDQVPASIKDFLANSPFKVVDENGSQEVKLVRKFGDEK
jgi:complement component 1 Q subcomponent-binding protein, mitochondrial